MTCDQVQDLFLDYVEQTLEPPDAAAIDAHLADCTACRQHLKETHDLVGELRREAAAPTPASPIVAIAPGNRLGDFELLDELGRGGMGIVYRARQLSLERIVALKLLPVHLLDRPALVARFRMEARTAARLHHTNIVPVYSQGEDGGHFYYAMELMPGPSLDRLIAQVAMRDPSQSASEVAVAALVSGAKRRRDWHALASLFAGVAEGLAHAHQHGVIHRDIKPHNLLLSADGQLRITDFGLARLLEQPSVTMTGEMIGTPAYMSPEQVRGQRSRIDHRTDIYSLGATLYEVLTGRRPFEAATREQLTTAICMSEPRPPRRVRPSVPIDLETICLRAMEKEPAGRYPGADEMAADLRRFADGRPIGARRVGVLMRAAKWVRRRPALTTILGLVLLLSIGATIWRVQSVRARQDKADSLVRDAFDLLAYDDYHATDQAKLLLTRAQPLGPSQPIFHAAMGLALLQEDSESAISHLRRARGLLPADVQIDYLLAWALRQRHNTLDPEALELIAQADRDPAPKSAAASFFRGQALVRHNPDEALQSYRQAIALRPNYAQAMLHLGRALNHWLYHHRRHDNFGEQERNLVAAASLQPKAAYPRYLLSLAYRLSAETYEKEGQADRAAAHYDQAIKAAQEAQTAQPDAHFGYVCESEYWEARGDLPRAIALRDKSAEYLKTDEDWIELHQYRWRLLYAVGRLDDALNDLRQLEQLCDDAHPGKTWFIGLLPAIIEADRGRLEEAVRLARRFAPAGHVSARTLTLAASALRLMGQSDEADQLLARHHDAISSPLRDAPFPRWERTVWRFTRGSADWPALESLARQERIDRSAWGWPRFIRACRSLSEGQRDIALEQLRACRETFDYEDYTYLATCFLLRMRGDPAWPRWPWLLQRQGHADTPG